MDEMDEMDEMDTREAGRKKGIRYLSQKEYNII